MQSAFRTAGWAIAAINLAAASPAGAASLEVAPTTVTLRQDAAASVLYVNNYGNAQVTVQIEPFDWTEADGKDRLAPSSKLMVSPPMAAIPPQGKQTVRLMALPDAGVGERSFRLLVSELPDPMMRADHSVEVLTRFSIPVFTAAAGDSGKIGWDASLDGDTLVLTAHNRGTRHAKLSGLRLVSRSGVAIPVPGDGLNYILAGSSRSWRIAHAALAGGDALRVEGADVVSGSTVDEALAIRR